MHLLWLSPSHIAFAEVFVIHGKNVIDVLRNTLRQCCNQLFLIYCLCSFSMRCVATVTSQLLCAVHPAPL